MTASPARYTVRPRDFFADYAVHDAVAQDDADRRAAAGLNAAGVFGLAPIVRIFTSRPAAESYAATLNARQRGIEAAR